MKFSKYLYGLTTMLLFSIVLIGDNMQPAAQGALDAISPVEAREFCDILASEKYAGRLTGHEGYTAAAQWAAAKFKAWGLLPVDRESGYLQAYPSPYTVIDSARMTLHLPGKKHAVDLKPGSDFLPLLYSDKGSHKANLVFVGWGISAPKKGYDDYAGVDVRGKFVACFRGAPTVNGEKLEQQDYHRVRMQTARAQGALGLLYFYPEPMANPNGEFIKGFTPAIVSYSVAKMLLEEKGIQVKALRKELEDTAKPRSFDLTGQVEYNVKSRHFPKGVGYNVAGFLQGSDKELASECLVLGGHFDHCGAHMGLLFPGANDNASGSVAVMEIAKAFASMKNRPRRSIVFVLFGGEEMGLMGSNYFVRNLPAPFKKVDGMFNFDMVGHGSQAFCVLSEKPLELKTALLEADEHFGLVKGTRVVTSIGPRSSDFAPFFNAGAPCIAFFSTGPHLHYHKTGDTIKHIDGNTIAKISRLALLTALTWSNR